MKIIKLILILFNCILLSASTEAQDLIKRELTKQDRKNNIISIYEYNGEGHFTTIKLCLYKNRNFHYSLKDYRQDVFCEGKWAQNNDTLIFTTDLRNDRVPIKLTYSNDSSSLINGFRVGIVKNLKGEEMPDGLVAINNDSNMCAPSYGICDRSYSSIDSIKVVFENKMSSEWIKVPDKKYIQIVPIVQTNFLISSYFPYGNRKYLVLKSSLKPID